MKQFEESIINYARLESLSDMRRSYYTYDQHCIQVNTSFNNGIIEGWGSNKCFFISISQGLDNLCDLSPLDIVDLIYFSDRINVFDTDNPSHVKCIKFLVDILPVIQIQIFIGTLQEDNLWYTTQDYSAKYGDDKHIIRILNKDEHFELITSPAKVFVRDVITMNKKLALSNQDIMYKLCRIKYRK